MTLNMVKPKQTVMIRQIKENTTRIQAIRLGLCEGTEVTCLERILGGPVIIGFDNQEVAIGGSLAQKIHCTVQLGLGLEGEAVAAS